MRRAYRVRSHDRCHRVRPTRRIRSSKRRSERNGSNAGSTPRYCSCISCARYASSSDANARSRSPRALSRIASSPPDTCSLLDGNRWRTASARARSPACAYTPRPDRPEWQAYRDRAPSPACMRQRPPRTCPVPHRCGRGRDARRDSSGPARWFSSRLLSPGRIDERTTARNRTVALTPGESGSSSLARVISVMALIVPAHEPQIRGVPAMRQRSVKLAGSPGRADNARVSNRRSRYNPLWVPIHRKR